MKLKGQDMTLFTGSAHTAVALATECSIEISADMVETSSALNADAKTFRPGRYSWTITTNSLVDASLDNAGPFLSAILAGTSVDVMVARCATGTGGAVVPGSWSLSGAGYVRSVNLAGSVGSIARYSAVIQGSGTLTLDD